jgi:hypothetical protein
MAGQEGAKGEPYQVIADVPVSLPLPLVHFLEGMLAHIPHVYVVRCGARASCSRVQEAA